jgi:hypothetical protein
MAELMQAVPVQGNATGPADDERTIDLAVGDIVVRLVTPLTTESRYSTVLDRGPRVPSFCVRVPDLDTALSVLEKEGVPTTYRAGALASTDPATTLGIHIDWTE